MAWYNYGISVIMIVNCPDTKAQKLTSMSVQQKLL